MVVMMEKVLVFTAALLQCCRNLESALCCLACQFPITHWHFLRHTLTSHYHSQLPPLLLALLKILVQTFSGRFFFCLMFTLTKSYLDRSVYKCRFQIAIELDISRKTWSVCKQVGRGREGGSEKAFSQILCETINRLICKQSCS